MPKPNLLIIEPYLNHSHRALVDGLMEHVPARWELLSLPGRFFRWRMRGAAAYFALEKRELLEGNFDGLVCSSMLGLAELKGLVPQLARVPALVYFHENQLAYPAPGQAGAGQQDRDLFLAFSNLTSVEASRLALFNSSFQRDAFLEAGRELMAKLPDASPSGLMDDVAEKSRVLPVPLEVKEAAGLERKPRSGPLRILWNHRWEHDKAPEDFFAALFQLAQEGAEFEAAVLGPRPSRWPKCFDQAPGRLGGRLKQLGPVDERPDYWQWLFWADVVVSTALQENQGLAAAEAVWAGCRPILPHREVYPHLYPERFLYPPGELYSALKELINQPQRARSEDTRPLAQDMTWQARKQQWQAAIEELTGK